MPSRAPDTIGFLIVDLARLFRRDFERAVAAEGLDLTAGEARTLLYVQRCDGIRQSALAEQMRIEPMTLSNFLDRLEARGLIRRSPDPCDRRAKLVTIADTAKPLVQRLEALAAAVRGRATKGFSPAEVETFRRTLQTMRRNLCDAAEKSVT